MKLHRLGILMQKERKQLIRDPFSILVGILQPIVLLLIFGCAMSLDLRNVNLAVVVPEESELASEIVTRFDASQYFTVQKYRSTQEGTEAVRTHRADACLYLPQNLPRKGMRENVSVQIAVNAVNASQAALKENYIRGILASVGNSASDGRNAAAGAVSASLPGDFSAELPDGFSGSLPGDASSSAEDSDGFSAAVFPPSVSPGVKVHARFWFNPTNESRFFMIPGVIVIIMTMIGTMLTSLLMAREYEHGNLESMFATPMTSGEILLAKAVNNFGLGILGLLIALFMAHFVFLVPIRGSLFMILLGCSVFLLLSLAQGLLISSATKNQFLASEVTLITTFMPAFILSGFLFEIKGMPYFIQCITYLIPARYFVDFLHTEFLVGDVYPNSYINLGIMTGFTVLFLFFAVLRNPKAL